MSDLLRFLAFGPPGIVGPEGLIEGPAAQRRTIALLAVISAAGSSGVRRDKILELLWPDADPDRARHALTQALYHARRSAGSVELFVGSGNDLRLNPTVITSDIAEFEAALAQGNFETAAALYRGPFLDGFSLPATPEFERWISTQRSRFAERAAQAMDTAASHAEKAEDWSSAVHWLRRLANLEPVRGSVAVRLMQAMAATGDRAGALKHARIHAAIVETELETSVDPAVTQLEQQLRTEAMNTPSAPLPPPPVKEGKPAEPATQTPTQAPTQTPLQRPDTPPDELHKDEPTSGTSASEYDTSDATISSTSDEISDDSLILIDESVPDDVATSVLTSVVLSPPVSPPDTTSSYARRFRLRRQLWTALAAISIIILLGVAWFTARRSNEISKPAGDLLVVTPFRVTGQGSDIAYLSEGLMDLLIASLTNTSAINAVDAGVLVRAWKEAGGTSAGGVVFSQALDIAKRFGGTQLVGGSALVGPSTLTITGWLANVATGEVEAQVTVEGSPDSLTTLVDRLSARLVAVRAGQPARLADRASGSLTTLRAYLAGRTAYRAGQFEVAARRFESVLARDTAFGEAAFWLMLSGQRANHAERRDRGLRLAWAVQNTLSDADRAYLTAFAGPHYPKPSSALEHLQAWESVVSRATDQPEAWQQLGEVLFHYGTVLDIRDAHERAERAFQRARTLDPSFALPLPYLVQLAALDNDRAMLDSLAPAVTADSSDDGDFSRWRLALARHDNATLRRIRSRFSRMPLQSLRAIAMSAQYDSIGQSDAFPAATMLARRVLGQDERLDALLGLHSAALLTGRPTIARQALRDMRQVSVNGARQARRLMVTDALYGQGDSTGVATTAAALRATRISDNEAALDQCVAAQWEIIRGNGSPIQQIHETITRLRDTTIAGSNDAALFACSTLLDALATVGRERENGKVALSVLDSLVSTGAPIGELQTYLPLVTARLTVAFGDTQRAQALEQMWPYMRGWPTYREY